MKLNEFKPGSIKELILISSPLMLASLSYHLMLFCDRLILSYYSLDAINAQATISFVLMLFQYFGIGITGIAEVFVGQFYGARKYKSVSNPVWQMIWVALILFIPYSIAGLFLNKYLVPEVYGLEGRSFFKIVMLVSFLIPLNTALSAFFIGRKKTKLIFASAIITNLINIGLGYCFVFGVGDIIPSLGLMGSAYAFVISLSIQTCILIYFFLNQVNAATYNTRNYLFDYKMLKICLKLALPNAVSQLVVLLGWVIIFRWLSELGKDFITVSTLAQNFFVIIAFITDGLQKAITTLSSNAIGAKESHLINRIFTSAVKLHLTIAAVFFIPLVIFPQTVLTLFIHTASEEYLINLTVSALLGVWVYFLLDGLTWIVASILTAGGDTKFIMFLNIATTWCFAVLPTMLLLDEHSTPSLSWTTILPTYAFFTFIGMYLRFRTGKWKGELAD